MTVEVTLSLPKVMIDGVRRFAGATQRDIETFLTDTLEMMWPMLEELPDLDLYPPISSLSDDNVLLLAISKMDSAQNHRLGELQDKGKISGLSEAERLELLALMQIYQAGQLRKSEAMAEAVDRGLQEPTPG